MWEALSYFIAVHKVFFFFFFFEILFLLRNTNVTEHMPRKKSQEFKDSQTIHSNYKSKKKE